MSRALQNPNAFTRLLDSWLYAPNINNSSSSIPADNAALTAWNDTGRYKNNTTQLTATNEATYKTGIINGKNVVRFDGNDYFSAPLSTQNNITGAFTVVFIGTTATIAAGAANFMANCNASAGGIALGRSGAKGLVTFRGVNDYTTTADIFAANTPLILLIVYTGPGTNTLSFIKNGVLIEQKSAGSIISSTANFFIGTFNGSASFWLGDKVGVGFAQRAFNSGEQTEISNAGKAILGI